MSRRRDALLGLAVAALGALTVSAVQGPTAAIRANARETSEAFLLPPPGQLVRLSLGYRAALADYLWAHVLVTQGLRLGERRRFETVTQFLDAITTLDPDFREPFRLADTLTTMQARSATLEDIRAARVILERGAERFPNDPQIWLVLGEFVTYVAPASYLDAVDRAEADRWRVEGAAYLARAAELGSHDAAVAWRAIGGARHLHKAGERQATIRFLRRALSVTEDPELRAKLLPQLAALEGEEAARRERARAARFEGMWRDAYPTWRRTGVLAAGPPFDPAACAGSSESPAWGTSTCATRWPGWIAAIDAEIEAVSATPSD